MSDEQLTEKDLITPEEENKDIKIENKETNNESSNNKDDQSFDNIINEFTDLINKCNDNDNDKTLYAKVDAIKSKYKDKLLNSKIPQSIENELIKTLTQYHLFASSNEKVFNSYISMLFDLYELLPYFYHPENFEKYIDYDMFNKHPSYDNVNKLELFKRIKPKDDEMNQLIDTLIIFLYENYTDYKSLYIENNLLSNYPSRSVFISFKFICLQLFLYEKITHININKILFNESLSSISRILLQESSYYNQKFNNEFYNNVFSEFEFNTDDKVKRKLSMDEFEFLRLNLFKFLYLIITSYTNHIKEFDFTSRESRNNFFYQVDCELRNEGVNLSNTFELNVYTFYIIMALICDVVAFIYTNFLYFNKNFTEKDEFHFTSCDPFFIFHKDWKCPLYYNEFLSFVYKDIFEDKIYDKVKFIEIFLSLCEIKNQYPKKYEDIYSSNSSCSYFINNPMNSVGLGIFIWMMNKKCKLRYNYFIYTPLYIFDIHLPLIASLLKTGHNLRYIAIEMLIDFSILFKNGIVSKMNSLIHYSFDDVFNDVLEFVGSGESEKMRRYVNSKLPQILGILSNEAKFEFFDYFINNALPVSEDKNLNDDKISYFIQIIKGCLVDCLENNNAILFSEKFVKKVIQVFAFESYQKIFIFEIIETISQALNFIHFAILKDKRNFNGGLHIYNKEYLYTVNKNLNEIANLVEKFVKSSDEEKLKTLRLEFTEQREDVQHALNIKKNQCTLLLELLNTVDTLTMKCLKEIDESANAKTRNK